MAEVLARSSIDFSTKRVIVEKVVDRRLGFETADPPLGWAWDSRHLMGDKVVETLPCPGIRASHLLGLSREYWQNGPTSGSDGISCKVVEIVESFTNGRRRWLPRLNRGDVTIWRSGYYLFSDDSVVETCDIADVDSAGRSYHLLARDLRPGSPIYAAIFKRNDLGELVPWRLYTRRDSFSGLLDSDDVELSTRDGDSILWDNVDTSKREFLSILRDEGVFLQFSRDVAEQVTRKFTPTVLADFNDLEYLGETDGSNDLTFSTKVFPVSDDVNFHCYLVDVSAGTWVEQTIVDTFTAPSQVIVDMDIGTVRFGTSVSGPTPAPATGLGVYVGYSAVPRIEYEEYGCSEYYTASEADVNPLGQSLNKGFVVITTTEQDIASIVLETTKPSYSARLGSFGPVYIGADFASLIAHVYSSDGSPVPNAEVTFEITTTSPIGSIGGSGITAQRRTDSLGAARTFYTPPVSVDEVGYFVTSIDVGGTLSVNADADFVDVDDVYTYYVLKDDPWCGVVGADTAIGEVEWSSNPPNGRRVIYYKWSGSAINPISGNIGAYVPVRPTSISGGCVLTYADPLTAPDPSSSTTNLGAYWIVSDRYISLRASVYSPRTRQTIYSDPISLRIEIPPYMRGEYIRQALDTIPFGFRLKDSTYEVASALNGATYICINPVAGPYPIIDVIAGETWESIGGYSADHGFWPYDGYPYPGGASNEFATLTFSFTIA